MHSTDSTNNYALKQIHEGLAQHGGVYFARQQTAGKGQRGKAWSAAKGGRPGYNTPGNVVTGTLLGLNPAPFNPRTPAPAPTQPLNNNLNTAPSYITGRVGTTQNGAGVVRSERVGGGDINEAYRLTTGDGRSVFAKLNVQAPPGLPVGARVGVRAEQLRARPDQAAHAPARARPEPWRSGALPVTMSA